MICQYCNVEFIGDRVEFYKHLASHNEKGGAKKMATLKEAAQGYIPPQTKNIADLDKFSVDLEIKDGAGTDKDGEPFNYKYVEVNGEQYRVPGKVLGDVKKILEANPTTKFFKVAKTGSGLATQYTVIQLPN